jgi:hypothetical protein
MPDGIKTLLAERDRLKAINVELAQALQGLLKESNRKFDVRKDYSQMVARVCAENALSKAGIV